MHLDPNMVQAVLATVIGGFIAITSSLATFLVTRKEPVIMANSSAILDQWRDAALGFIKSQADEISSLKSQLAGITPEDPVVKQDLDADESAIGNLATAFSNAGVTLPVPPVAEPVVAAASETSPIEAQPTPLAPAANSIADQLAAAEAAAGTTH